MYVSTHHQLTDREAIFSLVEARPLVTKLLGVIVGIEIPIDRLEGQRKVSQDEPCRTCAALQQPCRRARVMRTGQ